ncbi:MAG: hypothetical protein V1861_05655 [Candidatus Micrarchaeota archaeon]
MCSGDSKLGSAIRVDVQGIRRPIAHGIRSLRSALPGIVQLLECRRTPTDEAELLAEELRDLAQKYPGGQRGYSLGANHPGYPGINKIARAAELVAELKEGKDQKSQSVAVELDEALRPHLLDLNPANYW